MPFLLDAHVPSPYIHTRSWRFDQRGEFETYEQGNISGVIKGG
jgi:hypothetical protein